MLLKFNKNKKNPTKYSDFSSAEQKKILQKSIREANKEQFSLVEKFNKQCTYVN